jgi:hypothetical protein
MQATVVPLLCKTVADFSNFALHETVINSTLIRCIVFIRYKKYRIVLYPVLLQMLLPSICTI